MAEFIEFLTAVFWRWQSWAGGSGLGGAVVVIVNIYERLTGQAISKQIYIAIFLVAFLRGPGLDAAAERPRAYASSLQCGP